MILKSDPIWLVVYTLPNLEKKVAEAAKEMGVECYLPLTTVIRQWSDRKKKMEVPLFPNYVFVKVNRMNRFALLKIKGFVRFVSIQKNPVLLPEKEIEKIRKVLDGCDDAISEDYFQEGMGVRIGAGQFQGMEGVIIRKNTRTRLLIRIEGLIKAFSVNLPAGLAEIISPATSTKAPAMQ